MTAYEAFSLYHAIKLHFNSESYDFFKYNGKAHLSIDNFEKRKDKYYFYKLSRKFVDKDRYVRFLVSNFVYNEKLWVGDLLTEEAEQYDLIREKILQSMTYTFEEDCRNLFSNHKNPNEILKTSGEYPILLTKMFQGEIQLESFCILNMILNFLPSWDKKISDNIRYPIFSLRVKKYTCFLPRDLAKYKDILKKVIYD